jgi:hypothetical protein
MSKKFMQKAFDFFMQIIQRLLKPDCRLVAGEEGENRERSGRLLRQSFVQIYAPRDSTNEEVEIKTFQKRKMPFGRLHTARAEKLEREQSKNL